MFLCVVVYRLNNEIYVHKLWMTLKILYFCIYIFISYECLWLMYLYLSENFKLKFYSLSVCQPLSVYMSVCGFVNIIKFMMLCIHHQCLFFCLCIYKDICNDIKWSDLKYTYIFPYIFFGGFIIFFISQKAKIIYIHTKTKWKIKQKYFFL